MLEDHRSPAISNCRNNDPDSGNGHPLRHSLACVRTVQTVRQPNLVAATQLHALSNSSSRLPPNHLRQRPTSSVISTGSDNSAYSLFRLAALIGLRLVGSAAITLIFLQHY
ncbi:hypothetical protein Nepgr_028390 [Nepenthes gracilis]|uniref:Uncharacterized protein n=1 Tax=Nepenthes gracilis TaxID=150966 RepID=A0AAD3Y227_NEPGR|nr:hypothetical protein Nepgr_028390 [Nepenthes gracilis]